MTELWDWADVASLSMTKKALALPGFTLLFEGHWGAIRGSIAAAIRYGYEQAQSDSEVSKGT